MLGGHCASRFAAAISFSPILNPMYFRGRKKPGYDRLKSVKMTKSGKDSILLAPTCIHWTATAKSVLIGFKMIRSYNDISRIYQLEVQSPMYPTRTRTLHCSISTLARHLLENDAKMNFPGYYQLGHCLMILGQYAEATTAFEQEIYPCQRIP